MSFEIIPYLINGADILNIDHSKVIRDKIIVFLAGGYIVIEDLSSRKQKFIPVFSPNKGNQVRECYSKGCSYFHISEKANIIVLCEAFNISQPVLKVFSLVSNKRVGTLHWTGSEIQEELGVTEVLCLAVNKREHVVCVVRDLVKDLHIMLWNFSKSEKIISNMKIDFDIEIDGFGGDFEGDNLENAHSSTICSFHPTDFSLLAVTYFEHFSLYRINELEKLLYMGPSIDNYNPDECCITNFTWLVSSSPEILFFCEASDILYFAKSSEALSQVIIGIESENKPHYSSCVAHSSNMLLLFENFTVYLGKLIKIKSQTSIEILSSFSLFNSTCVSSLVQNHIKVLHVHSNRLKNRLYFSLSNGTFHAVSFELNISESNMKANSDAAECLINFHKTVKRLDFESTAKIGLVGDLNSKYSLTGGISRMSSNLSRMSSVINTVTDSTTVAGQSETWNKQVLSKKPFINFVTGVSCCIKKPFCITSGADKQIILFNYATRQVMFRVETSQHILDLCMQPSGNNCIVAFKFKVSVYKILFDNLACERELDLKGCHKVTFAEGGHLFACATPGGIQIFSKANYKQLILLRGHRDTINTVRFVCSDSFLLSCGLDGAIYIWDILSGVKKFEYIKKNLPISSVCVSKSLQTSNETFSDTFQKLAKEYVLICVTVSGAIKIFDIGSGVVSYETSVYGYISAATVLERERVLIYASQMEYSDGENDSANLSTLNVFSLETNKPMFEIPCSAGQVNGLIANSKESLLLAVSSDGLLAVYVYGYGFLRAKTVSYDPLMPINSFSLHFIAMNEATQAIQNKMSEEKLHFKYNESLEKNNSIENNARHKKQQQSNTKNKRNRVENLKTLIANMQHKLKHEKKEGLARSKNLLRVEELSAQKKLNTYTNLTLQAQDEKLSFVESINRKRNKRNSCFSSKKEVAKNSYSEKKNEMKTLVNTLNAKVGMEGSLLKELTEQNHNAFCSEIAQEKKNLEEIIFQESLSNTKVRGSNTMLEKKFHTLRQLHEMQLQEIKMEQTKHVELLNDINSYEDQIKSFKFEVKSRDCTISCKEKNIHDLKKKAKDLDKIKYILDYKIRDMKSKVEPRQNELFRMKKEIESFNSELEIYHSANIQIDSYLGTLQKDLNQQSNQYMLNNGALISCQAQKVGFISDLEFIVTKIQEEKQLVSLMKDIKKHHGVSVSAAQYNTLSIGTEYEFQRTAFCVEVERLRQDLKNLKNENKETAGVLRASNMQLIVENSELRKIVCLKLK